MWVGWLIVLNGIVPLFFLQHTEAYVILAVFMLAGLIGSMVFAWRGFTRLMGLMHVVWLPMLVFLSVRLASIPTGSRLNLWIRSILLCNGCSLIIDITDVVRYALGDRDAQIVLKDGG